MTRNQIEFAKHKETNRNNLATEAETYRSNTAKEYETNRHNMATERLGFNQNAINASHYVRADEEAMRSNMAREALTGAQIGLGYSQLSELNRSNLVNERIRNDELTNSQTQALARMSQSESQRDRLSLDRERFEEEKRNNAVNRATSIWREGNSTANLIINGVKWLAPLLAGV